MTTSSPHTTPTWAHLTSPYLINDRAHVDFEEHDAGLCRDRRNAAEYYAHATVVTMP